MRNNTCYMHGQLQQETNHQRCRVCGCTQRPCDRSCKASVSLQHVQAGTGSHQGTSTVVTAGAGQPGLQSLRQ